MQSDILKDRAEDMKVCVTSFQCFGLMISLYACERDGLIHLDEQSCMIDDIGFNVAYILQ